MANKNKHVIIGYFPSKEAATEAAAQLKAWDKRTKISSWAASAS